MKQPNWDVCPPSMGSPMSAAQGASELEPGMVITAFLDGHRVEVSLDRPAPGGDEFEGHVAKIHTSNAHVGDLAVGDEVVIPVSSMCVVDRPH